MQHYKIGIRVYTTDRAFYQHDRSIDFLIDGKTIKKEDVVFVAERPISRAYKKEFKKRGYKLVEVWKHGWRAWVWAGKEFKDWYTWHMWGWFFKHYSINHYVVYNDFNPLHHARTEKMAFNNVTTWFYLHACNFLRCHQYEDDAYVDDTYTGLHYDKMVVFGRADRFMKRDESNHIGEYVKLGCLWSENLV